MPVSVRRSLLGLVVKEDQLNARVQPKLETAPFHLASKGSDPQTAGVVVAAGASGRRTGWRAGRGSERRGGEWTPTPVVGTAVPLLVIPAARVLLLVVDPRRRLGWSMYKRVRVEESRR